MNPNESDFLDELRNVVLEAEKREKAEFTKKASTGKNAEVADVPVRQDPVVMRFGPFKQIPGQAQAKTGGKKGHGALSLNMSKVLLDRLTADEENPAEYVQPKRAPRKKKD
jgi:hypothetical protein